MSKYVIFNDGELEVLDSIVSNTSSINEIINGDFDIWQRNEYFTINNTTNWINCADRWTFKNYTSSSTCSIDVTKDDSDIPSVSLTNHKSMYSLKILVNTLDSTSQSSKYAVLRYTGIEGFDFSRLYGKTVTLSFKVKSSLAGTYSLALTNEVDRNYITEYTIDAADTWEAKSISLTFPSDGTWTFTTGKALAIWFVIAGRYTNLVESTLDTWLTNGRTISSNQVDLTATADNYINFSQVKLSADDNTQFTKPTFDETLRKCRRYYEKTMDLPRFLLLNGTGTIYAAYDLNNSYNDLFYGVIPSVNNMYIKEYSYLVKKRIEPSITLYARNTDAGTTYRKDYIVSYVGTSGVLGVSTNIALSGGTTGYVVEQIGTERFRLRAYGDATHHVNGHFFHGTFDAEFA